MPHNSDERIFYVKNENIPPALNQQGFTPAHDLDHITLTNMGLLSLGYRHTLETDDTKKQLVVYCYVTASIDGQTKFLTYFRDNKEDPRLKGLASIGWGGHVNDEDYYPENVALKGIQRELKEELNLREDVQPYLHGFIADFADQNIGRFHVGLVYSLHVKDHKLPKPTTANKFVSWMSVIELLSLDRPLVETWSYYVIHQHLNRAINY